MKGSIQKKGKIYYAVIAINGKRKWYRGGDTKKSAQKVLNDHLYEIGQGTYKEIPKMKFNDYSKKWLKSYAEVSVKPSTLKSYKDIIKRLFKPAFGNFYLTDISTGQLQSFVADRSKDVSAKTACNEIVVMKEMFKHALRWGYLKQNPAEYVERPRLTKKEIEILSPDEAEKLWTDKNKDNVYRVAFLAGFLTGMRAGEIWGLQWTDIDWNSKQIYVRRSLWKGQFQTPKSKCSIRKIDMTDRLVYELKRWKLACPVNDHDVVFPSPEGKLSIHDNVAKRYFNEALRKAKLRQVSFHSLRHSNASLRIHVGQNIKYIQSQLGHASINITMDIYGHLFNDANFNRQQADLLDGSYQSVRNPLEKPAQNEKKDLELNSKSLILNGSGGRI
jgi:integrase